MFAWGLIPGSASNVPLGTTQSCRLRLNFGTGEPQLLQKQRGKPGFSFVSTKSSMKVSPRVHFNESLGNARLAA